MLKDRDTRKPAPDPITRRACMCGAVLVGSLGALSAAGDAWGESRDEKAKQKDAAEKAAEAKKKVSKERAAYQDQPKGKDNFCASCKFFTAPASCRIVDGTVSPQGWCQLYEKRSS